MADTAKGKGGSGCLPSCGCFCGCWAFVLAVLAVSGGLFITFLAWPFWKALKTTPQFPEMPRIEASDRDSFEEKRVQWQQAQGSGTVEFTLGEVNAWLARFRPPPASGLLVEHVWVVAQDGRLSVLADGSGFFCKRLSMACEFDTFSSSSGDWPLRSWQLNAWVEKSATGLRLGRWFLDHYLQTVTGKDLIGLLAGITKIEFATDRIRIEGVIPEAWKKRQGEEK
ncbi:MAG TPA: hypothetical protein PKO06_04200 [Candidatus Ozemobacteraceae bacterium]|nr:hypothetical protein [Candidatus Ozemobacteraceae bacterium]